MDATIRANGVLQSGSKEYFDAIDRQMRQKYPGEMMDTAPTGGTSSGASGYSGGAPGNARIPASVAAGYRKMGIDIDDPKVARRMLDNRQKAVSKGWLPEQAGRNLGIPVRPDLRGGVQWQPCGR